MKTMPKSVFARLDKGIQDLLLAQGVEVTEGGSRGKNEELFVSLASDVLSPEDVRTMQNGLKLVEAVNKALAEQNINGELQLAFKTIDSAQEFGAVFAGGEKTADVKKRLAVARGTKKS